MLSRARTKMIAMAAALLLAAGGAAETYAALGQPPATKPRTYLVSGTITQLSDGIITVDSNGKTEVITYDRSTTFQIIAGGRPSARDLKVGMRVSAQGDVGQPATKIDAWMPTADPAPAAPAGLLPRTWGTVAKVGDGSVTLEAGGKSVAVALGASTVIQADGKDAKAGDLKVGMRAWAVGQEGKPAAAVRAYTPAPGAGPAATPTGPVRSRSLASGTIVQFGDGTVTVDSGDKVYVAAYDDSTRVRRGAQPADIVDVKAGVKAAVFGLEEGKPLTGIILTGPAPAAPPPKVVEPTPVAVNPGATMGRILKTGRTPAITVDAVQGPVLITYDSSTRISINGQPASGADLKVGMHVNVLAVPGKPATTITVVGE